VVQQPSHRAEPDRDDGADRGRDEDQRLDECEQGHGALGVNAAVGGDGGAAAWARSTARANTPMRAMTPSSSSSRRLNAACNSGERPASFAKISATAFAAPLLPITPKADENFDQRKDGWTKVVLKPGD
jgi:hypothetical protein